MNIDEARTRLEETRDRLKAELGEVAVADSGNPGGYVGKEPEFQQEDNNVTGVIENASHQEEFSKNQAITNDLEVRLGHVEKALEMIEDGTYGICQISGEPIEEDRLEALPSATTCKKYMDQEVR